MNQKLFELQSRHAMLTLWAGVIGQAERAFRSHVRIRDQDEQRNDEIAQRHSKESFVPAASRRPVAEIKDRLFLTMLAEKRAALTAEIGPLAELIRSCVRESGEEAWKGPTANSLTAGD